jgi:hypothetical protein
MVSSGSNFFKPNLLNTNSSSDAFDGGSHKVKYPVLLPSPPDTVSLSSTASGEIGFQMSPSLRLDLHTRPELGVGTAVRIRKVSTTIAGLSTASNTSGHIAFDQASSPLKATEPRNPAHYLPATGQIAAMRTGSPVSKHLPKSKFNGNQGALKSPYGSLKCAQQIKASVKQEVKVVDDVFHAVSANSSNFGSPQRIEDITRRYQDYGIGPTVKYAKDAHQIIMGDQSL